MARRGIRIADLLDPDVFRAQYDSVMEEKVAIAKALGIYEELDLRRIRDEYEGFAERIRPMVRDTAMLLNQAIRDGKTRALRGRAGDHARYRPWDLPVRDLFQRQRGRRLHRHGRGAHAHQRRDRRFQGLHHARGRRAVSHRGAGCARATRSASAATNSAPVTGRPRRCGWFDAPLMRYTAAINGFDSLVVTKLDVLDELEKHPGLRGLPVGRAGGGRDAANGERVGRAGAGLRMPAGVADLHVRHFHI